MSVKKAKQPRSTKCRKCKRVIKFGEACYTEIGTQFHYHIKCFSRGLVEPTLVKETLELSTLDMILPNLKLQRPCPIKLVLDTNKVSLFIGPRDFQWSRLTGEHIASGTMIEPTDSLVGKVDSTLLTEDDRNSTADDAGSPCSPY